MQTQKSNDKTADISISNSTYLGQCDSRCRRWPNTIRISFLRRCVRNHLFAALDFCGSVLYVSGRIGVRGEACLCHKLILLIEYLQVVGNLRMRRNTHRIRSFQSPFSKHIVIAPNWWCRDSHALHHRRCHRSCLSWRQFAATSEACDPSVCSAPMSMVFWMCRWW